MRFGDPQFLWLLVLVPLFALFLWWAWQQKQKLMAKFVQARLLPILTVGISKGRHKIRMSLLLAVLGLLAIVLARPQWGFGLEEIKRRGLDIAVAIDTSKSMLADDVAPNRLVRAKLAALDLKEVAGSDRLGLVAFAGSAFLQCPLSLDDGAFRQSVEALDVNIIPQGGTAIGEAIRTALSAFKEKSENHKILVLFTDGEDHDGEALSAAREAAKEGLRIFTIGVGTAGGELLRTTDQAGVRSFLKDAQGNVVKSRLNESMLQQVAQAGNGFYLLLTGTKTIETLYQRGLAPLPKGEFSSKTIRRYHDRFQWFLGAAIVLLLAEMFFPEPKAAGPGRSKTVIAPVAVKAILLCCVLGILPREAGASPRQALRQYQAGRYNAALNQFEKLTEKKPDDPRLHYNAGTAAFQAGEYDQAHKHFNSSLSSPDVPLQQRAYYNLGNTQFRLGEEATELPAKKQNWEAALSNYESALKLDANDADAKYNMDLVKKRLEELKQQQEQQKNQQENKDDKDKDKQEQKEKQGNEKDKKEEQQDQKQQGQEQQKKEADDQQKQPGSESKPEQDQKPENAAQPPNSEKKDDQKQAEQKGEQSGQEGKESEAAPVGKVMQMTPQQAARLLDAQRGEEKAMIFIPQMRTNRNNRAFKDW